MTSGIADRVKTAVEHAPTGSFIRTRDLVTSAYSRGAVDTALHRLASSGQLVSIRPGLYFKGQQTRFGPTRPDPITVGMEIARHRGFLSGVGPAGVSAARLLGLTSQVPSVDEIAVPGRAPAEPKGIKYRTRSAAGRQELTPTEVAVLELLRDWPRHSEATWSEFVSTVAGLCGRGAVNMDRVRVAAGREHHVAARTRANELADEVKALPKHQHRDQSSDSGKPELGD